MKINPVSTTNYQISHPPLSAKKKSMGSRTTAPDLNLLNKTYNQLSFKAVPANVSLDLVKKIPLEDRLASIFQNFKHGKG